MVVSGIEPTSRLLAGTATSSTQHTIRVIPGFGRARPPGAIGVQPLRGGDNTGEHTVLFVGGGERLELIHCSSTRDHFARGAVRTALWLCGRDPGLYPIEQVLGLD